MSGHETAFAQALAMPALVNRLRIAALEPRSYTRAERAALMQEAARRLEAAIPQPSAGDPLRARYGFVRLTDGGIACVDCGARFPLAEGSVMRGHRRRCPISPHDHPTPGVCDA
jgi:hypothetical protein